MRIKSWAGLMAAAAFLAGCGNFWQAPNDSSTSFSLSPSGTIVVAQGSSNTETITVTPGSSFTGTVTLSDTMTGPSTATSATDPTITYSSSSLTFSSTTTQSPTLTVAASSSTPIGAYEVTVTGVSGSVAASTKFCVAVGATTSSCTSTASNSGNFYVLSASGIYGYSITNSELTALSGSPASVPTTGLTYYSMAIDPTGKYLYVGTSGGIFLYDIQSGKLTLDTNALISDITPYALQVDSTGQWLLDASNTSAGPILFAWPLDTTNGEPKITSAAMTPYVPLSKGNSVGLGGLAISPDHNLVAVAAGTATEVVHFTAGSSYTSGYNPFGSTVQWVNAQGGATAISVAFNPGTNFLFIGESGDFSLSGGVRLIPISSGILGSTTLSPIASGGSGPHAILADSNGFVYVANWEGTSAGNITPFLLDTAAPSLTQESNPATTGAEPVGMVLDSTGNFILTANNASNPTINALTVATTGEMAVSTSGSAVSAPVAIVAAP
jgi:6-phosphogluconolactonase (cycloisomerase 2 family)